MDNSYQKRKFTELRFEYYTSGRLLWFNDTMSIGAMLLGYAVELSLKYLPIQSNTQVGRLFNSHDCLKLCVACENAGIFFEGRFSHDLLQYVTDGLKQRYPKQSEETSKDAIERGQSVSLSLDMIIAYDDLIVALDDIIKERVPDGSASIALRGAEFINRKQGRAFFHVKIAAAKNINAYKEYVEHKYQNDIDEMTNNGLTAETIAYNMTSLENRKQVWDSAPESIWHYKPLDSPHSPDREKYIDKHLARDFRYPGEYERFEGNGPIITRSISRSLLGGKNFSD